MKYVIMGSGNLGQSFQRYCYNKNLRHVQHYRCAIDSILESVDKDTIIFNTEGYGSIPSCEKNPFEAYNVHLMRNIELMTKCKSIGAKVVCFSTNYHNFQSVYSNTKVAMENFVVDTNFHSVIRVANLYGQYKMENSLPYKLIKSFKDGNRTFAINKVYLTDCDWLTSTIFKNIDAILNINNEVISIVPTGETSPKHFLDRYFDVETKSYYDNTRPIGPSLHNTFVIEESIYDVWDKSVLKQKVLNGDEVYLC